jgi:acyl-CoA synthetase (AMP-forming)/AMP-acid ligase II
MSETVGPDAPQDPRPGPGRPASGFWALVQAAAQRIPDSVVVEDDDGRRLSAGQFARQAEQTAAGLLDSGIEPGDTVSWQLPTTLEAAVLMAALSRLDVVQNPIIPAFRTRELGFILGQIAPDRAVAAESWRGEGPAAVFRSFGVRVLGVDFERDDATQIRLPSGDPARLPAPPEPGDECRWIYYSSGTTSVPKGARHTDRSVIASSHGVVDGLGMRHDDVYPIAWPFAHIGGISMLSAALRTGATLVLFGSFDPLQTPERMAAHEPTVLGSATPFFNAYIAAQRRRGTKPLYSKLRACVAGGAPTPERVSREVSEVLGVRGVAGAWGLTEFPVATSESPDDATVGTTVGRPASGVEVRVVGGELWVRGPQRFLGYVDASLDDEVLGADGWLRTGDLGTIDAAGRVHIEGRSKDVVIRNAENVSSAEVEGVIAGHAAVADVAVIGIPDEHTGERVCAVVVLRTGHGLTLPELSRHCQLQGLARFKCPEHLVVVSELPRNTMGKVLKQELRSDLSAR